MVSILRNGALWTIERFLAVFRKKRYTTMLNSRNVSNVIQVNEFSIFDGVRSNAVSSESNEISDVQMDDEVILTASVTYVNE